MNFEVKKTLVDIYSWLVLFFSLLRLGWLVPRHSGIASRWLCCAWSWRENTHFQVRNGMTSVKQPEIWWVSVIEAGEVSQSFNKSRLPCTELHHLFILTVIEVMKHDYEKQVVYRCSMSCALYCQHIGSGWACIVCWLKKAWSVWCSIYAAERNSWCLNLSGYFLKCLVKTVFTKQQ